MAAEQAAAAIQFRRRRQLHTAAVSVLRRAARAVHAAPADWDRWLAGGAHAALGSFVVLASSHVSGAELAAYLARVTACVTDAASEEGGAEMWLLLDILMQQEARLQLELSAAAS